MLNIYKTIFWILLFFLLSFNFFLFFFHGFIIGIYPYVASMTVLLGIGLILNSFVKELFYFNTIIEVLMGIALFIFIFTLFQIWRNTRLLNDYQSERSQYMDQLMNMTKQVRQKEHASPLEQGLINLIEADTGIPATLHNRVSTFNDGAKILDDMIEEIAKAQHHIHIEFFIARDDSIGNKLKEILLEKARAGVEVRFLYDGLGSKDLGKAYIQELRAAGAEMASYDGYSASVLKGKLNHRNHRKILIVDGKVGFVGGFNIGDEYLGRDKTVGNWRDMQIKIEGEAVRGMQQIFLGDWYYVKKEKLLDEEYFPANEVKDTVSVQMVTSGFDTHWNEISQLYFSMITGAQKKVYIATPYLILNDSMMKALQTAALKGVDVRIFLPHKPDFFMVGWANESFFERLLKAKVKIYLYNDGFLHAKILMIDDRVTSVGSANFNTRSLFLDYEVNGVVYDQGFSQDIEKEFQSYLKKSTQVTYKEFQAAPILQRIKHMIGRLIVPFA